MLTFGSLFAGIGGIDLGLERAGMTCKWQVEVDSFCLKVLAKHWPNAERFGDVRECGGHNLAAVDLVCGGFPCQDISRAGKKAGITGERSGLWSQFARIIRELRPDYVLLENVPDLLTRGIGVVFGDLAESGYDAEWGIIPALAFGSPQLRERIFVLAYPNGKYGREGVVFHGEYATQILAEGDRNRAQLWAKAPAYSMGMANGIPSRVDRLRGLGNTVMPQAAEWIGRQIIRAEGL